MRPTFSKATTNAPWAMGSAWIVADHGVFSCKRRLNLWIVLSAILRPGCPNLCAAPVFAGVVLWSGVITLRKRKPLWHSGSVDLDR